MESKKGVKNFDITSKSKYLYASNIALQCNIQFNACIHFNACIPFNACTSHVYSFQFMYI